MWLGSVVVDLWEVNCIIWIANSFFDMQGFVSLTCFWVHNSCISRYPQLRLVNLDRKDVCWSVFECDRIISVKRRAGDKFSVENMTELLLNGRKQNRAGKLDNCKGWQEKSSDSVTHFCLNCGAHIIGKIAIFSDLLSYMLFNHGATDRVLTDAPHWALESLIPPLDHGVRPGAGDEADEVRRPRVWNMRGFNCCCWKLIWQNRDVILMSHRFGC